MMNSFFALWLPAAILFCFVPFCLGALCSGLFRKATWRTMAIAGFLLGVFGMAVPMVKQESGAPVPASDQRPGNR